MSISWLDHPAAIDPAFGGSESQRNRQIKPLFGDRGFSFKDFLDIINPLQHLPVIGSLFRSATETEINPGSRLIGGALYGGPIGLALALVNTQLADETGADLGDRLIATLTPTPGAPIDTGRLTPPPGITRYAQVQNLGNALDPFSTIDRGIA